MTVYILSGSNRDSCAVFGVFSTKEKAYENEQKLRSCACINNNKYKLEIIEEEVDNEQCVDFFFNE